MRKFCQFFTGLLIAALFLAGCVGGPKGLVVVDTPTAVPDAGAAANGRNITLACATACADIYYTINGSNPTTRSKKYTAPFAIYPPVTVKAIAVKNGMANRVKNSTVSVTVGVNNTLCAIIRREK